MIESSFDVISHNISAQFGSDRKELAKLAIVKEEPEV
jgi:hypothetical protein